MATSIKLLRTTTPQLRPDPGLLDDGLPMVNLNETEPGLYFKARDGSLIKTGTATVGPEAPNSSPAGHPGNIPGELWLDTSDLIPALKVWSGSSWIPIITDVGGDVHVSNEGSSNAVDSTWGSYTIQGGEDDLFLINHRNGKQYKFLVQEV